MPHPWPRGHSVSDPRRRGATSRSGCGHVGGFALVAFAGGLVELGDVPDAWRLTAYWRTTGLLAFAGLWTLLAWSPRGCPGVWEVVVLHKVLMTAYATAAPGLPDASTTAAVDGALAASTLAAWWLCRGWTSWAPRRA